MRLDIRLDDPEMRVRLAALIREARTLAGWSQRELAGRARTSQPRISRFETGSVDDLDVVALARVLSALGMRGTLAIGDHHLDDRRRQVEPVHAALAGRLARWLRRLGWLVATEVQIGPDAPRGWIDLLAWRRADGAGLVSEVKGDLRDVGGLQRQVQFYASVANSTMRSIGWRPSRITTLVVAADTVSVHGTIRANATLLRDQLPGSVTAMNAWLHGTSSVVPQPTIATMDPLGGERFVLRRTPLDGRRSRPAHDGYAEAAAALGQRRRTPA